MQFCMFYELERTGAIYLGDTVRLRPLIIASSNGRSAGIGCLSNSPSNHATAYCSATAPWSRRTTWAAAPKGGTRTWNRYLAPDLP